MLAGPERVILVVDDDETVRTSLSRILERDGYTVVTAESAHDALVILKQRQVHLVISDQEMPGMTGVELLKLIRERHPDVCRIMLTGKTDFDVAVAAINEGEVYRFLPKPWDNMTLKVTVHFAFEHLLLEAENRRLVAALRRQVELMRGFERQFQALSRSGADLESAQLLAEADLLRPQRA
jgi:DNA-binding NtrC family response regulator